MNNRQGISTSFFTNPLYVYAISFLVVLLVFSLKWSRFYSELSGVLLLFILFSSIFSILFGHVIRGYNVFRPIPESKMNKRIFAFIVCGNLLEYIYCRNIPLFSVIFSGGNYRDFEGIPMFHVLLAGVSLFFGTYVFHQYQSDLKNKKLLCYILLLYIPYILSLNRGVIVYSLLSSMIVYFLRKRRISFRIIIFSVIGFVLFLLGFGFLGNIRSDVTLVDDTYILKVGGATDVFLESHIPQSLYWGYIYIASPIGNLEETIDIAQPEPNFYNFVDMIITQTTPDFVAKRLQFLKSNNIIDEEYYLTNTIFNAPTVYSIPYVYMGWSGIVYMFVFMIAVVYLYTVFSSTKSAYFLTGWSFLSTVIILNTFNNMWFNNGLYIVAIPVVLSLISRMKLRCKL